MSDGKWYVEDGLSRPVIADAEGRTLAEVVVTDHAEAIRIAHLMRAAPALLEACQAVWRIGQLDLEPSVRKEVEEALERATMRKCPPTP